jgi:hypothetical protein
MGTNPPSSASIRHDLVSLRYAWHVLMTGLSMLPRSDARRRSSFDPLVPQAHPRHSFATLISSRRRDESALNSPAKDWPDSGDVLRRDRIEIKAAATTIPETPAGRTFKAWSEAFNSGDRELVGAYCRKYEPSKSVEDEMQFRGMTGGFDLLEIVKSEKLHLEILLKERHSETKAIGKLA